jgi:hypothetical protein
MLQVSHGSVVVRNENERVLLTKKKREKWCFCVVVVASGVVVGERTKKRRVEGRVKKQERRKARDWSV